MQAARMTFEEEVIKLRSECRSLRIRNNNLEKRNSALSSKVERLEQDNRQLRQKYVTLEQNYRQLLIQNQQQAIQIESLNLIVEELRKMVFGKKKTTEDTADGDKNGSDEDNTNTQNGQTKKRKMADRSADSYRRPAPPDEEVTATYEHPLTSCPDCGTFLTQLKQVTRYIEDLADLTGLSKLLKRIEKHIISTGFCQVCKRRKAAIGISPQVSVLGEQVKQFICYLSIVMRMSFEQIGCFLSDTAGLNISDGEITVCLDEQAEKLTPEKDRLLAKIRGAPGRHYDETGWKVQQEGLGNYCWISRPTEGTEAVFLMGRSRGKGNAEELQGNIDNQVGISDDYGAYKNMFEKHQLCMAHPKRKLRDLHESKTLSPAGRTCCTSSYQAFSQLYEDLEKTLATKYQKQTWLKKRSEYIKRIKKIAVIATDDPQKLKAIKQSLAENAQKYFTCLLQPGIPADNNKAERGLRHIVLKRKISYGSKTQKGADTMSILSSTLLSAWWNKPANFFVTYNRMITP